LDEQSDSYLKDKAGQLRAGQWPGPSTITELIRLHIILDHTVMEVMVLDYPGGNFTEALAALRESEAQTLRQFVHEAEVVLLLLDPALDLGVDGQSEVMARQEAFITTLAHLQIAYQQGQHAGPHHPIWLAMVVTKCDRYPQLAGRGAVRRLVDEYGGPFRNKLAEYSTKIAYFAVSAVGATRPNPADPDHPLPASQLTPTGYEELFRWIIRKRLWDRIRPWVKRGAALACIGAICGGVVGSVSKVEMAMFTPPVQRHSG